MGEKRDRIGLLYSPSSEWIAEAYYVQNIALALKTCDDALLPEIVVFCFSVKEFEEFRRTTGYPYLDMRIIKRHVRKGRRFLDKLCCRLTFRPYFDPRRFPNEGDDVKFLYPLRGMDEKADLSKYLAWIPDFQDKYLTHLFTKEDLEGRDKTFRSFIDNGVPIVLSSRDAQNDLFKFYPQANRLKTFVLPFAVTHPDFSDVNFAELKQRFGIKGEYLFCANQFWMHKNHLMLFKAYKEALDNGLDLQLVCSGKLTDYRNQAYATEIRDFIAENNLSGKILLTGFMERTDQLCLMSHAAAVVQPSLFEGWSTVVEDAKALGKFVYLSNLRVHQEQMKSNVCFFDPYSVEDLSQKLLNVSPVTTPHDYKENIRQFGEIFIHMINDF